MILDPPSRSFRSFHTRAAAARASAPGSPPGEAPAPGRRARSRIALAAALAALAAGCGDAQPPAAGTTSAAEAASAPVAPADAAALDAILQAEQTRVASAVRPEHLASHSAQVRIAAARALARIGGEGALPGLVKLLADDHPDVVTWSAYGLGFWCRGHEQPHVTALAARAVALLAGAAPGGARSLPPPVATQITAIARAAGSCGGEVAEATLVAWLAAGPEVAEAAALGLGDLAAAKSRLREETIVALLQRAAGSAAEPPLPAALYPIGRIEHPPPSTIDRVREVATAALGAPGPSRLFAVRALGRAGEKAAAALGRVAGTPGEFTPAERGEAARALVRLGKAGQGALAAAVPAILPPADPIALTGLVSEDFGATLAVLEALTDAGSAEKALREIASRPAPPSPPAPIARRLSWLRCAAAKAVVGKNYRDPLLVKCEIPAASAASPAPSAPAAPSAAASAAPSASAGAPAPDPRATSIAPRAIVEVIGRGEITGARLAAWRSYADGPDLRAREAAIALLEQHDEVDGAAVLAKALGSKLPGVVSAAAEILTTHPERAADTSGKKRKKKGRKDDDEKTIAIGPPSPAVVKALLALLQAKSDTPDPEIDDALLDAAGALGLKEALPRAEELCRSPQPSTREHAAKAITLLSGKKAECLGPVEGGALPAEMHALATARTKLVLQTDVGQLTLELDPSLAPVAVTRFIELARAGYYDGVVVHRVVAGFVTQFGALFGDGSGGPEGKPPLRCETSPLPFEAHRAGVALAGRDTGTSQLFVMHGRFPHLDGKYALVGAAEGPWAAFVDGDVIQRVTIAE